MAAELRRHGFDAQWTRVDTEEDFVAALDEGLDVVLSDFSLPGFDAFRAIAHVNRRALTVPVIVVSGTMGEETAAQCIREGAADYLLKDRLGRLGSAVERAIELRRLADERQQIEKALIASQSELATVFDSAPVAMVILDRERRIVRANRAAAGLAGRPAGDAFGRLPGDAFGCAIALDDPTGCRSGDKCAACPLRTVVTDTLEHGAAHHAVECTLPFAGREAGVTPTMLVSTSPIETSMGALAVVSLEDITARKRAEERERKLNRLLGTIREVNQLIVREKNRTWMLAETCRITVEQGQFAMAWIGEADYETGEVRPLAAAGDEAGYLEEVLVRCDDSVRGHGPAGTSIREGRTVVVDDVAKDGSMAPWREAALARGYHSVISLPLAVNGRRFGVLAAYAQQPGEFDEEIVSLLEELAEDVGFAVGALETAEERERAELALEESEERHRQLFEAESDAILMIDNATGAILEANAAAETLYGYTRDEILSLRNHDLSAEPEDTRRVTTDTPIQPDQVIRIPLRRHRRKDGTELPVEITGRFFIWKGRPVHVAAVRDISERRRAEEALRRDLEVRAALNAISRIVIGDEIRVPEVAAAVLEHARRLTSSEHGFVSEIDLASGDTVCHTLTEMLAGACGVTGEDRRIVFPRSPDGTYAGLWGHVLNTREAFFTNHALSHAAVNGTPVGHVPLERYLAVPVVSGGELLGMIALANPERDYGPDDLEVVGRLADYYGVAIQRARWEDALQESEERYRTLFEQAPTGIYRSTPDGRILAANPALVRMLGYDSFEELAAIDLTREGYANPEGRQAFRERVDTESVVAGFESEWRTRDGRTVFVRENARAIRDDSGAVVFYEGTVEDVSERRRSDEALKASEERYRSFFEEDLTADYITTLDGRLVDCNPAYVKLFGFRDRAEAMATGVLRPVPAARGSRGPDGPARAPWTAREPRDRAAAPRRLSALCDREPRAHAGRAGSTRADQRLPVRRHRAAGPRGAAPPGPEDGGRRPTRRRRGARLQQPAPGPPEPVPAGASVPVAARPPADGGGRARAARPPRGSSDASAPAVLPSRDLPAAPGRPQHDRAGPVRHAQAPGAGEHRLQDRAHAGAAPGRGRHRPNRAGHDEPRGQRVRCPRGGRRGEHPVGPGRRRYGVGERRRRRSGRAGGDPRPDLRALLHHQIRRPGHGARSVRGPRHRDTARRERHRRRTGRRRERLHLHPADRPGRVCTCRSRGWHRQVRR